MAGIGGGNIGTDRWCSGRRSDIGVLIGRSGSGGGTGGRGPGGQGRNNIVSIAIVRAVDACTGNLVIGDGNIGKGCIPGIGNDITPGYGVAGFNIRPRSCIRILTISGLFCSLLMRNAG